MAAKPTPTKAVAVKEAPQVPAIAWDKATNTGFENVGASDLGIPFLVIVQKGSPEVDKTHKNYSTKKIDGVECGAIINTVSREILYNPVPNAKPFEVIPVFWDKFYVEWAPRTSGRGIVRVHDNDVILGQTKKNEKGLDVLPSGNIVVTTAYFHVLIPRGDDAPTKAIIGLTSTQLKKSRQWLAMSQAIKLTLPDGRRITPPLFSHTYQLSTTAESNDKGSWMGWKIEVGKLITDAGLAEELDEICTSTRQSSRQLPAPEGEEPDPGSEVV